MALLPAVPAALALAGVAVLALSFGMYLALQLACGTLIWRTQDLKKRYNAEWALVTGASSGASDRRSSFGGRFVSSFPSLPPHASPHD